MLREKLVEITLEWEKQFGVAPNITGTVSEYDAAMLVGMSEKEYSNYMQGMTAVHKGFDFLFNGILDFLLHTGILRNKYPDIKIFLIYVFG